MIEAGTAQFAMRILGVGSECVFDVYEAVVVWDGVLLTIPVDEAGSEPLVTCPS